MKIADGKQPKKSDLFVNPNKLPSFKDVMREFQKLKGINLEVNPDFATKIKEIQEAGKKAVIRLSDDLPKIDPKLAICVICDSLDICDPCDALDFDCSDDACIPIDTKTCILVDACLESD